MVNNQVRDSIVKNDLYHEKVNYTDKKESIRQEQLAYDRYVNEGGAAEWLNYCTDEAKHQK